MLDPLIHQETRLRITAYLHRNAQATFARMARDLMLSDGNLGGHLARLQTAGYVGERAFLTPLGFERRFALTRSGTSAYRAYLEELEEVLRPAAQDAPRSAEKGENADLVDEREAPDPR